MNRIFLSIIFPLLIFGSVSGEELTIKDQQLWNVLHEGNFSLGHKMLLTRQPMDTNDEILSQFMFLYLYYKHGNFKEVMSLLEWIDYYVEHDIICIQEPESNDVTFFLKEHH